MYIAKGWAQCIDVAKVDALLDTLEPYLPDKSQVLRAFEIPPQEINVVIMGQDPYPTRGHAHGLAFSTPADVRNFPASLRNIFREYVQDTGFAHPSTGDLTPWTREGVLLLNRTLTVAPGAAGSHRGRGWEEITQAAMEYLVAVNPNVVAILWGNDAATFSPLVKAAICSPHPSPLSAHRGFFGSRPFTRANELLSARGVAPVEWRLP